MNDLKDKLIVDLNKNAIHVFWMHKMHIMIRLNRKVNQSVSRVKAEQKQAIEKWKMLVLAD